MAADCVTDYKKFEFHAVAQRLQNFCSEDLGGFWLDILKDRLYTTPKASPGRRSAQTALNLVSQMLLRLMAPILSFTAEEAWAVLHPGTDDSVFFHTWNDVLPPQEGEPELIARWKRIRELRALVVKRLEESRSAGEIGSSLQAEVALALPADDAAIAASLGDDLKYVLITSAATVRVGAEAAVSVMPSQNAKCERCWHWREDVGTDPKYATLCGRCARNLEGPGEERVHA